MYLASVSIDLSVTILSRHIYTVWFKGNNFFYSFAYIFNVFCIGMKIVSMILLLTCFN